ncbi:cytochrome b5-like [Zootermopsis nevadensis]|uniref:Cytochrome b5 n=1 Tax=Zootermopsis nevadensis TaxID=136037 RepID=A0A067RDH0_ZOONE|nr:cytochrome b5-like [Zootermopsis nevadensis]KDR17994.1 Cytochrome b5 [Zootermopsis nevadensis]
MSDEVQQYSLEEIKVHNTSESAWCIYKNGVYDITKYIDEHPGGGEQLLEASGGDMTEAFDDFGHSDNALQILKKLKIGELRIEDRTTDKKTEGNCRCRKCCVIM